MKIAFDGTAILGPLSKNRGIGNYALSQFKNMIELDCDNQYYFFNLFEEFSMREQVKKGNVEDVCFFTGKKNELIFHEEYIDIFGDIVKKFLKKYEIDVFYITSPFESKMARYKKEWFDGVKVVATVYDIIPYVMRKKYLANKEAYRFYMECVEMLRWVDEYLVISGSVKEDMIKYLDFPREHIHVIYGAADPEVYKIIALTKQEQKEIRDEFGIENKFIMCTGGDDDRKNIEGLIRAYSKIKTELKNSYQLVIVCKLSQAAVEKYTAMIRELKIEGRVILTNFVSTEDLVKLYNMATLMAFPSLYEGFGLPILEAWRCGTPVLTSNNSSLGEIAKDAAVLVDPATISDITEGLNQALMEFDLDKLLQKGQKRLEQFSWEKVAEKSLEVFQKISQENRKEDGLHIKKIAMFTPLPPVQSGIADYSVDIISQLKSHLEIDIYIDKYKADMQDGEGVKIRSCKEFEKHADEYDRIIYQVGNSLYHEYMFPYIQKYPGIVVLHDYNLRNVLEAMYLYKKSEPKKFVQNLSEDLNKEEADQYMKHLNTAFTKNYEINGFVTNYAKKIIVHSNYAKQKLLEKDIRRNVSVIPLYAILDHQTEKREEAKGEIVFSAFGHIHETKRILPALRAFGQLCQEAPEKNMKFYFVGKMAEELNAKFYQTLKEMDLESRVIVTGFTTLKEFQEYMDAADICVNLRFPYNGESSASFMRLLGKGKCTIVNRIGSFAEVPEDACLMIDNVENMTQEEEVGQIYHAMRLALDDAKREQIQKQARAYAKEILDLEIIGGQYLNEICVSSDEGHAVTEEMIEKIADGCLKSLRKREVEQLSKTLAFTIG